MYSVADPEANPAMPTPSSLAIDFGTLQRRNKHEILGNTLNFFPPPAECLDMPLHVFASILHLQRIFIILFLSRLPRRIDACVILCVWECVCLCLCVCVCANCRLWTRLDNSSLSA